MFGKSFEEKVNGALEKLRGSFPSARISASVDDKTVVLKGEAPDMATKGRIMEEFNRLVETDNTINQIAVAKAAAPAPAAPVAAAPPVVPASPASAPAAATAARTHLVVKGDTLSAISKKYYGNANQYMKIFEANRDQLTDPNKIQVGQKLVIPE